MSVLAVVLGLAAAASYGTSDFGGGLATKRASAVVVLAVSQATGLTVGLVAVAVDRHAAVSGSALGLGGLAGILGVAGLALLYTGLAAGPMHTVAPLAAVIGATVPALWGLLSGERPSPISLLGVVLAVGAVAIATRRTTRSGPAEPGRSRRGVPFAVLAGIAFGLVAVILANVSAHDGLWPVVGWRLVSFPIALVACIAFRHRMRFDRAIVPLAIAAGVLEVLGNALYIIAARNGLLSLVGVLASLAPLATVILGRAVLAERMSRAQAVGLAVAMTGVVLIAVG